MTRYLTLFFLTVSFISFSGDIIADKESVTIDLEHFDELTLNGSYEVYIYQDGREEITIEGPEDYVHEVPVKQKGRKVTVGKDEIHKKWLKKVKIYVHLKEISRLEVNGISKLVCETPITGDELAIECNGIRDVDFELRLKTLRAEFSGIGNTYLYGYADDATIHYTGIGSLFASELKASHLRFESTGIGKAEVFADQSLHIEATGLGNVYYAGNPTKTSINRSGIGSIKEL